MSIDIYAKSSQLLERLANSIYDRSPDNAPPLFFSTTEIHLVENWLKETINENDKFKD